MAWTTSGASALTGRPDGPGLGPPERLVERLDAVADVISRRSCQLGVRTVLDPLVLLTERAAIGGSSRGGTTSCGGATRLIQCGDGSWIAVSIARPSDVDVLPAWLGISDDRDDPWPAVVAAASERSGGDLVENAVLLGLAASLLPAAAANRTSPGKLADCLPASALRMGPAAAHAGLEGLRVLDLGSLWAGPLCGAILAEAGASVVKVESSSRPDGARFGPTGFFDLMNARKRSVALDFESESGRRRLRELISKADVVIEASRPRALSQLGVDAAQMVTDERPSIWISLTGHGREQPERIGFGDDSAVAGGLVCHDRHGPVFCADAIADPSSGLVAAAACLEALAQGERWSIDIALADVAAHLAGPTLDLREVVERPGVLREASGQAPPLGQDTDEVLDAWGVTGASKNESGDV